MLEMLEGVLELLCCRNPSHKQLQGRSGRCHSPYMLLDIQGSLRALASLVPLAASSDRMLHLAPKKSW
jgi:hypothetical protein